jgi:hypothetical protein
MQDQRELVEDQRGPHSEHRGRAGEPRRVGVGDGQRGDAADQHQHDPEHHVVDVQVADLDVLEPPAHLRADQANVDAHGDERDDERHEEAEQWQPPGLDDALAEESLHGGPRRHTSPS